jgi:hypothetical protein
MIIPSILTLLAVTPTPSPGSLPSGGPPLSLTLILGFTCCAMILVVSILVLSVIAGNQNRKSFEEQQDSSDETERK